MIPARRAGFVVLTDRYIYSLMARAIVRGADPEWMRGVYCFALKPDAILYLRVKIDDLVTRVLQSTGFDYWESGMDLHMGEDMYARYGLTPVVSFILRRNPPKHQPSPRLRPVRPSHSSTA